MTFVAGLLLFLKAVAWVIAVLVFGAILLIVTIISAEGKPTVGVNIPCEGARSPSGPLDQLVNPKRMGGRDYEK